MSQVTRELLEKNGYTDWVGACELLMIGKDKKKLQRLREVHGFSDFTKRGLKICYKIDGLWQVRKQIDKGLIKL